MLGAGLYFFYVGARKRSYALEKELPTSDRIVEPSVLPILDMVVLRNALLPLLELRTLSRIDRPLFRFSSIRCKLSMRQYRFESSIYMLDRNIDGFANSSLKSSVLLY